MAERIEIRASLGCAEPCGACTNGGGKVIQVLVAVGQRVGKDELLMVYETIKNTVELAAPKAGRVIEVAVADGDEVEEDALLLALQTV